MVAHHKPHRTSKYGMFSLSPPPFFGGCLGERTCELMFSQICLRSNVGQLDSSHYERARAGGHSTLSRTGPTFQRVEELSRGNVKDVDDAVNRPASQIFTIGTLSSKQK